MEEFKNNKFKNYQNYLAEIKRSGVKPFFEDLSQRSFLLKKIYYRLTNISVKKLKTIPKISQASNILDIGCGTGDTLRYIKEYINPDAKLYGIDIDKNTYLPDFVEFKSCNIEHSSLPYEDNTFDIVISNFVLEHLQNPQKLFEESFRILKKGGYFYCSTDYYTSLFCPDYWNFYSDPTHVRPWTKRSLKILSNSTGFKIYKIGIIRWWEFLPLLPIVPILNLTKSNFSFIPFEILGRTVYLIAVKP